MMPGPKENFEMDYSEELFEAWADLEAEPDKREVWEFDKPPDPWTLPISSNARRVLIVIGWYSPMTNKGLTTAIFKRWGKDKGAALLLELESRKLVRVLEDERGRSVWSISKRGITELGKDYSPKGGQLAKL